MQHEYLKQEGLALPVLAPVLIFILHEKIQTAEPCSKVSNSGPTQSGTDTKENSRPDRCRQKHHKPGTKAKHSKAGPHGRALYR